MKAVSSLIAIVACASSAIGLSTWLQDGRESVTESAAASSRRTLLSVEGKPKGKAIGRLDVVEVGPLKGVHFDGVRDRLQLGKLTLGEEHDLPRKALSIGGWVNVRKTSRWGAFACALQDNGGAERGWTFGFENDRFSFGLATTGADDGDGLMTYLQSKTVFDVGRWYHVAATYDGETMRLYVNGRLDASSTTQSGDVLYPAMADFVVGGYVDADEDYPFSGWIHGLDIEEAAWSPKAIADAFAPGKTWVAYRHDVTTSSGDGPAFVVKPYLQFPTRTTIHVMWETERKAIAAVEYGRTSKLEHETVVETSSLIHDVLLEDLEPRTQYFYRVRSEDAEGRVSHGEILTFRTAVEPDDAYAFTVIGDTQKNPDVTGRIAQQAFALRPSFQIHAGDLVSTGPIKREWVEEFFAPSSPLMSRVAVYPVLGNHERNAHWFYDYFALPEPEYRYTFRYGNAQFFMLDTNKDVRPGSEQYRWLDEQLAASEATWKFAVHHHPIWSSDSNDHGDTYRGTSTWGNPAHRPLAALYEKHGVDIVFNGHIHMYERTWPLRGVKVDQQNGVRYITTGGSGGGLEAFAPSRTWFTAQGARRHHFCYVAVHEGTLRFRAYDIDGRMMDVLEIDKSRDAR